MDKKIEKINNKKINKKILKKRKVKVETLII